jgi:tetratricopeptide (TPR) repeat protein
MAVAQWWTGQEASALRHAHRMSIRAYAQHLGVAVATVANWDARGPHARLRTETQQLLDTDLARATNEVRNRFAEILAVDADATASRRPAATGGLSTTRAASLSADDAPAPPQPLALWAPDEDLSLAVPARTGRRIGRSQVRDLSARAHRLRLADDVLAGGDLIATALRDLRAALRLYRDSAHTEVVGRAVLAQISELAQITGWIASDAGLHALAERVYRTGVSAARHAGDPTLAANLLSSLAYQHVNTGRADDGVELAHAAVREASPGSSGAVRALYLDRLAWAYARTGQAQPALRALECAHEALCGDRPGEAPLWAYWVNQDELEVMDARVLTEIHCPARAVPLLTKVLDHYDPTHAREAALYLSWLAIAYADADEPQAATSAAARMLDLADDLPSARTVARTRVVLRRLARFDGVPELRDLLASHPVALRARGLGGSGHLSQRFAP